MGFTKKTWKNRIAEYINRRLITMEDGSTNLVTVARDEGTISQEGDAFNAVNMNDLEDRIEAGFADVSQSLNNLTTIATLWEHPNFSNTANFQEFAPQTLSIANLGNYDIIGICHSCYDRTRCRFNFIPNILNAQQVLDITWNSNASGYEFRAYQRNFKISGNEIIFYEGYSVRNGTREKNNSFAIPIKIIGIKLK